LHQDTQQTLVSDPSFVWVARMEFWYIRRGDCIIGPTDLVKLKELAADGLLPTDQLAKDAGGPWTEASMTAIFAMTPTRAPHLADSLS
jgi:hypothetical protein